MLDAYTVRKAIPRIVIAVIGINLSIYLCIALIDVFNIIGGGVGNLLTAPFGEANLNEFGIQTDKANSIVAGVGVIIGAKPLLALLVGTYGAITTGGGGALLGLIFFTVILPIILVVIGIFAVVIIRQALLIFLTIISPVAIACFVLPGTEKYFQKWWGLFVKTLLVYPIIAVIFAMSDIFGSIIFSNNQGGLTGVARIITGIIVIYAPLFMIPFAFRFAGGAIAQLSKFASGAGDRVRQSGFVKARREHYGQKFQDGMTRAQEQSYDKATKDASGTGIRRQIGKFRQKAYAGYRGDIKLRMAEIGKREAEKNALITGNADDSIERAYTADQASADADWQT